MSDDLIYSTESGDLRKNKKSDKKKTGTLPPGIKNDGVVRIQKESKGRGGKVVTCIYGTPFSGIELSLFVKNIKQKLGVGGNIKDNVVVIQGDKVENVKLILEKEGLQVKVVG